MSRILLHLAAWYAGRGFSNIYERAKGVPYLFRAYLLGSLGFPDDDKRRAPNLYLHRFMTSDLVGLLHNHPWQWAFSIVLTVGYWEERLAHDGEVVRRLVKPWRPWAPWRINLFTANTFHRVELIGDQLPWTLFLSGPRLGVTGEIAWGFYDLRTGHFQFTGTAKGGES